VPSLARKLWSAIALAAIIVHGGAAMADTRSRGSIALDSRVFVPDDVDQTDDTGIAVTAAVDVKARRGDALNVAVRGFARADAIDQARDIVAVEEAYVSFTHEPISVAVGPQILNWTATEAFHPADVINSRNFDSDLASFEKLGEPMVSLRLRLFKGYVTAYYMPVRIPPNFPPDTSRLSLLPVTVKLGDPLWMNADGKQSESWFANQAAVMVSQTIGPADVAIHAIRQNDRFLPTTTVDSDSGDLRLTFHTVNQLGLTYVQVLGGLIMKAEAAYRTFVKPAPEEVDIDPQIDYWQAAAGLEYGWTTSAGHDATIIVEGQLARAIHSGEEVSPFLLFQRGILIGYSHFFNDIKGRRLVASVITDARTPYLFVVSLSYLQRLSDEWSIDGTVRSLRLTDFGADDDTDQIKLIATMMQLRLTRHF
jgi:hypothetical protein